MHLSPRRATAATLTILALGAGATPALAGAKTAPHSTGSSTALAQAIKKAGPSIDENVSFGNRKQDLAGVPVLERNIANCNKYAQMVSDIHADSAQHTAQLDWVTARRLQAAGDQLLIDGAYAPLHANPNGGGPTNADIQAGLALFKTSMTDDFHAQEMVGLN